MNCIQKYPKISIIIPLYNREKLIKRCLDSILSQGIDNIDIIVVDDGSTDDSLSTVEDISKNNPCIKVLHKENGGASSARNLGIKNATGEYLMFVDSDDYILEGSFNKAFNEAFSINSSPDLVYFGFSRQGISGSIETNIPPTRYYDKDETHSLFMKFDQLFFGSPCFKLYKRSILDENKVEFDITMVQYEDAVFNFNFIRYCQNVVSVATPIYFYDCYTNVKSKKPSLFRGDGWVSDVKKYYDAMLSYCKSVGLQNKDAIDKINLNIAWQFIPAIYSIYRSKSSHRYKWLRKIVNLANSMIPGWNKIPRSGIPRLIANVAKKNLHLCHVVCSLIFSAERLKHKFIT